MKDPGFAKMMLRASNAAVCPIIQSKGCISCWPQGGKPTRGLNAVFKLEDKRLLRAKRGDCP